MYLFHSWRGSLTAPYIRDKYVRLCLTPYILPLKNASQLTLEILNIADIPTTLETWLEKQKPFMSDVPLFNGVIDTISQLPKTAIVTSQNQKEMQAGFYQLDIAQDYFRSSSFAWLI